MSEDLSPLELLRQENELLRKTINSADKDIEELEAQLQVIFLTEDAGQALYQTHCCFEACVAVSSMPGHGKTVVLCVPFWSDTGHGDGKLLHDLEQGIMHIESVLRALPILLKHLRR